MGTIIRQLFTGAAALVVALVLAVALLTGTGLAQNAQPDMPVAPTQAHTMPGPIRAGEEMQSRTSMPHVAMCPGAIVMGQHMVGHGMSGQGMMHGGMMHGGVMNHGMMNRGMMRHGMMQQGCMMNGMGATGAMTNTSAMGLATGLTKQVAVPESFLAALADADAEDGRQRIFVNACTGCHALEEGQRMVGPTWHNLAKTAATRVPGQTAEEYLYTSIVRPNAYVVPGYLPNVMIQTYGQTLHEEDLASLVKYLLTLRG